MVVSTTYKHHRSANPVGVLKVLAASVSQRDERLPTGEKRHSLTTWVSTVIGASRRGHCGCVTVDPRATDTGQVRICSAFGISGGGGVAATASWLKEGPTQANTDKIDATMDRRIHLRNRKAVTLTLSCVIPV
jgi:hypothetical protein